MRTLLDWPSEPRAAALLRFGVAAAYTAFITVLILQPSGQPVIGPAAPPGPPSLRRELLLTLGHVAVFIPLLIVWYAALRTLKSYDDALRTAARFCLLFAVVSEIAQVAAINRSVSFFDAAANCLGIGIGIWIIARMNRR